MLAIVEPALNIRGAVLYNEEKLSREQARFLDAHNFLEEKEDLTLRDKLQRFRSLTELNERSRKKCIHFSVNFPPTDHLSDKEMKSIATEFMQAIDFGDQPWLLYRHTDVGHPHMHIVTTNIRPDGSRISNDLRSPHHLKQVCFQIEEKHHLHPVFQMPDVFTPQEQLKHTTLSHDHHPMRATYGEKPTKTTIGDILEYLNKNYSFTSFEAYNALLSVYNVRADRGREDSAMYQNHGLYYRLIDEEGKKLGAPIKASAFHLPVTLDKLEEKFELSRQRVPYSMLSVKANVGMALHGDPDPYSLDMLKDDISRHGLELVIPALRERTPRDWEKRIAGMLDTSRPAAERQVIKPDDGHGFFYVDFFGKNVLRDTEVGREYTAAAILQQTGIEKEIRQMHENSYFKLSDIQKAILRPDFPDTTETRRLLLQLSPHHNDVVENQLELQQQQELSLRHSRGLRL